MSHTQRDADLKPRQPRALWFRVVTLLLTSALLAACAGWGAEREGGAAGTAIADVLADPADYRGQQLTLSGQVSVALSSQAFRIEDEGFQPLGDGPRADGLLVVIPDDAQRPPDIDDEMDVEVTGELRAYEVDPLDQNIGAGFNPAVHGIAEGEPMLVAQRVLVRASVSDLDQNPGAYLHNEVTVSGRVAEVLQEGIVRVEDLTRGGSVLVFLGDAVPASAAPEGQELVVTGLVRQFRLEEFSGELGLNLDSGIFAGWDNRTVIMAESIGEP